MRGVKEQFPDLNLNFIVVRKFTSELKMMEKLILTFYVRLQIPLNTNMLAKFQLTEVMVLVRLHPS